MLLDEVSSNLDIESEKNIHKAIINTIRSNNSTVISITHRKTFINEADRVFLVKDKEILELSSKLVNT